MAVISTDMLRVIEKALGKAYKNIQKHQGDTGTVNATTRLVNQVKLAVRGGADTNRGLYPLSGDTYGALVTPVAATYSISIATGAFLKRDGTPITIGGTVSALGPTDARNNSVAVFSGGQYAAVVYAEVTGDLTAKYNVRKADMGVTTYAARIPVPSTFGYEVPVAVAYVATSGVTTITDIRDRGYFAPTNDDVISDLFAATDRVDNEQATKSRTSELSSLVTALRAHVKARSAAGLEFGPYCRSLGITFSDEFRELYAAVQGTDITQDVAKFQNVNGAATVTQWTQVLKAPSTMEVYYTGPSTSAAATVTFFPVQPTYTTIRNSNYDGDAKFLASDETTFGTTGDLNVAIAMTDGKFLIRTHNADGAPEYGYSTPPLNFAQVGTVGFNDRVVSGGKAHVVTTPVYVFVPTYTASGSVLTFGTAGTKALGVALATYTGAAFTSSTSFLVRVKE